MVRLWIETSATYPGTYAALGCGYYPPSDCRDGPLVDRCTSKCHVRDSVEDERGKPIMAPRFPAGSCPENAWSRCANLSRPEKSYLPPAGSLGQGGGGAGESVARRRVRFKTKDDPVYRQDAGCPWRSAHDRLMAGKRFDMPGFRPNKDYLREMQRFGFLPKTLGPNDPVDPYAIDRAYWDSFLHRPNLAKLERKP